MCKHIQFHLEVACFNINLLMLFQSAVMISYKMPVNELKTVKDYKEMLTESMFLHAMNQRFFKISRRKDPPYFSCSTTADELVRPLKACMVSSSCKERGTLEALESVLLEVCVFCFNLIAYLLLSLSPPLLTHSVCGVLLLHFISDCKSPTTWVFRP